MDLGQLGVQLADLDLVGCARVVECRRESVDERLVVEQLRRQRLGGQDDGEQLVDLSEALLL